MPKVGATMADISTERTFIEPGLYRWRVKEVDLNTQKSKNSDGQDIVRETHVIKSTCVGRMDGEATEHEGRAVVDFINIHTKEGEPNEISLANLKRYFEACLGEGNFDPDDTNTDDLKGLEFQAEVYIDSYKKRGASEDAPEEQVNRFKPLTILPIE